MFCEFCSSQTFKSRHRRPNTELFQENVCMSIQKVTASSWGFCLRKQCLWVALEKPQTAQHLSPAIIQSLSTAVCPTVGGRQQLQWTYSGRRKCCSVLCCPPSIPPLFLAATWLYWKSFIHYHCCHGNKRGNPFHQPLRHTPSFHPFFLSLSISFPPCHHFLYLSVPSLVILLSSCLRQREDAAPSSINRAQLYGIKLL